MSSFSANLSIDDRRAVVLSCLEIRRRYAYQEAVHTNIKIKLNETANLKWANDPVGAIRGAEADADEDDAEQALDQMDSTLRAIDNMD